MNTTLKSGGWLKRVIEIPRPGTVAVLTYSGRGLGTEKVSIEDTESVGISAFGWFVPRFKLNYENDNYIIEIRVWPWLTLRSMTVEKNGKIIYSEGKPPYRVSRLSEIAQLISCIALLISLPFLLYLVVS